MPPGYIFGVSLRLVFSAPPEGVSEREESGRPQFEGSRSSAGRTSQPSSPITGRALVIERVLRGGEELAQRLEVLDGSKDPDSWKGGDGEGQES